MTDEVQAAVEHLQAVAIQRDGGYSSPRSGGYAEAVMSVYGCLPEKQFYADIRAVTAALAASEARRVELEGENTRLREAMTFSVNLIVALKEQRARLVLEKALKPQQEKSE